MYTFRSFEVVVPCLDEGVVAFLDNSNKDDFEVWI